MSARTSAAKARPAPAAPIIKPPYRIMSMAEIRALEPNGFTVASTFSGGGGSSTGYRMAGFRVVYANEFVEAARDTYRANMAPDTALDGRDIREVSAESILAMTGLERGEIDLLDGSPPCSSFSKAGKREAGWGEAKAYSTDKVQRTDDLFYEFARVLDGLQPKTFVAENVAGLVEGAAKGYFLEILARLKACGYRVEARLLDASWLGVPQARRRLIFVGVRADLDLAPAFPAPLPYRYATAEALPWLADPSVPTPPVEPETCIARLAIGREWERIRPGQWSTKYTALKKPFLDKPCQTITARAGEPTAASVVHPTEKRKFSVAEIKRLSGFPDDFELAGTYEQRVERCGRAVPPEMMMRVAETLRDEVLGTL